MIQQIKQFFLKLLKKHWLEILGLILTSYFVQSHKGMVYNWMVYVVKSYWALELATVLIIARVYIWRRDIKRQTITDLDDVKLEMRSKENTIRDVARDTKQEVMDKLEEVEQKVESMVKRTEERVREELNQFQNNIQTVQQDLQKEIKEIKRYVENRVPKF